MKQILKLEPEIKYVNYDVIYSTGKQDKKLKIKCYGDIREDIFICIHNSIYFLPNKFKSYIPMIESFEIRKATTNTKIGINTNTNGIFNPRDYSIKLYDRNNKYEVDYSEILLHELGHLIFDRYDIISYEIEEDGKENPVDNFIRNVKNEKIQPISEYLNDLQFEKFDKYDYADEIFAGYFGFTYSRYCNPYNVKGSFNNYIKLRNLFWTLLDEIDDGDLNG